MRPDARTFPNILNIRERGSGERRKILNNELFGALQMFGL